MNGQLPHRVVAIDGPAASGKSTVARLVARRLGFVYVNTGAMYRAVTWLALRHGVNPSDADAVLALLTATPMECGVEHFESTIRLDGEDPSAFLSTPEVSAEVSHVAALPQVREVLVARQREFVKTHDLVMEGRDIGTVVFPQTRLKFYIDASEEVRAARRAAQGIRDDLPARDRRDASRTAAPLRVADDAEVIDSTHLSIDEVVDEIIRRIP